MNDKTDTADMRGHNLPPKEVHDGYIKKLIVIERDKQSQAAKNRAGMKRFKDDAEEVFKAARADGVSVKALKHVFKVENFLQKNVKNAADRMDNDILDEARAIMEQVSTFDNTALGVYANEDDAAKAQKEKDAAKIAASKEADAKAFDKTEKAKAKKEDAKS